MTLKDKLKSYYLCIRFPFLKMNNEFRYRRYYFENYNKAYDKSGKIINKKIAFKLFILQQWSKFLNKLPSKKNWYNYIPEGWRDAFGMELLEDIRKSLKKSKRLRKVRILDVKEKWGSLSIYFDSYPGDLRFVLNNYELVSRYTCIKCGKVATHVQMGWISPYCESCCKPDKEYKLIDEVYKPSLELENTEYDFGHNVNHNSINDD